MAKAQLYLLKLGYHEIGVGTITQVQAAQKAIEALQLVETEFANGADGSHTRFLVEAEDENSTTVGRFNGKVLKRAEFARESIKKICGPAEVQNGKPR